MNSGYLNVSRWRYRLIEMIFFGVALVIVGQAFRLHIDPVLQKMRVDSEIFEVEQQTVYPPRGLIFDRWGNVLASNKKIYEVGADLRYVSDQETIAQTLAAYAGSNYSDVIAALNPEKNDSGVEPVYAVLDNFLTEEEMTAITAKVDEYANMKRGKGQITPNLNGLYFVPRLMRVYPEQDLASNIIGFVNYNGESFFGIEENYQDLLAGNPLQISVPLDPNRVAEIPEIPEGASLVLTIDREIQAAMEDVLDDALQETGADDGTILVTNPETGEILAMAVTPRMDLNKFTEFQNIFTENKPYNKGASQAYEPGSVFKVLTMAAALDSGAVNPGTTFMDTGIFEIGGIYIRNWNSGAWGYQDMQGCMQHSLNVCLAWIASQVGPERYYDYMNAFGFGQMTGLDLAGEASGRLKMPGDSDWYDADLGTNSFGQGVAATPVQMAMAISSVANDGKMMAPHIMKSVIQNGRQYNTQPQVVGTPISAETARTLTDMLAASLVNESSDALVEGYSVAGKTGTAEIPTPMGYTSSETNASFVGWGPVDDPKFLVYVWLERPETSPWGSVVASPVFREAVERLVVLLNLPPDNVRHELRGQQ